MAPCWHQRIFFLNLNNCKCYQLWADITCCPATSQLPLWSLTRRDSRSFWSYGAPSLASLFQPAYWGRPTCAAPLWPFSDWLRAGGRLGLPLAICARQRGQLRRILTIQRMRLQQKSDPGFPRVEEWMASLSPSASCMPFSRRQVAAVVSPLSDYASGGFFSSY